MPPSTPALAPRLARLGALAAAVCLALDAVAIRWPALAPPYLLLAYMDDAFRDLLSPIAVALGASLANGGMAALLALALEDASGPRAWKLALALAGLWVGSGAVMLLLYVRAPWGVALGSLAVAVPRAAAVAWVMDRLLRRDVPAAAPR